MARRTTSATRQVIAGPQPGWAELKDTDDELLEDAGEGASDGAGDESVIELDESDDGVDETALLAGDNVGDQSVEINVEALIAEIEAETTPASRKAARRTPGGARRQLEDYWERRRVARAIEDLEDFEV